jgi:hypothetical protein
VWNHRKGTGFPGVTGFPQGDHGTGFGLLQWVLAKAAHGALIFGSEADYVNGRLASKFKQLPRCDTGKCCVGVRPILENSTACQKSMPSLISVLFGGLSGLLGGSGFSLVE